MKRRAGTLLAYVDMLLVIVAILIVSVAPKKVADGVQVKAEYLVTIEWSAQLDDDIDLWAVGPPDPKNPVFYQNLEGGALSLDRDSRGYLDDRLIVDNHLVYLPHKETMSLRGIVPGHYVYGVHAYKTRPADDHRVRDPHALGIVVHVEVVKINPKVVMIHRADVILEFEGDSVNIWSMDVMPDGGFVEAELPVEPITARFYQGPPGASSHTPGAAPTPGTP
jgi:hypothetical protein